MKLVSNHKLFEDFFDEVEVDARDDQFVIEEEPYREDYDYICYIKTIAPEYAVAGKLYLDNSYKKHGITFHSLFRVFALLSLTKLII